MECTSRLWPHTSPPPFFSRSPSTCPPPPDKHFGPLVEIEWYAICPQEEDPDPISTLATVGCYLGCCFCASSVPGCMPSAPSVQQRILFAFVQRELRVGGAREKKILSYGLVDDNIAGLHSQNPLEPWNERCSLCDGPQLVGVAPTLLLQNLLTVPPRHPCLGRFLFIIYGKLFPKEICIC